MNIAYYNDTFIPLDEINSLTVAKELLLKTGVFTTILVEDGDIYFLKEHLQRLQLHLKQLNIFKAVIDHKILFQLIEKNNAIEGIWRMRVIIDKDSRIATLEKEQALIKEIKLALYLTPVASAYAKLKTFANFKRKALLEHSKQKGYDDCITFDLNQNILETAIANIFWIKANTLYYPDPKLPYLHGITLAFAIKVAKEMNMNTCPGEFKLKDLEDSEVFYCNSIKKVIKVGKIEGISIQKNSEIQAKFINYAIKLRP